MHVQHYAQGAHIDGLYLLIYIYIYIYNIITDNVHCTRIVDILEAQLRGYKLSR